MRYNKECCPYCKADLQGESILKNHRKYMALPISHKIGVSSIVADRIIKWKCPDCSKEWDRD